VGNLQAIGYAAGVTNLYQYDALNRVTNAVWRVGNTALASFGYTLGPTGNRTNLAETVNGASRSYNWTYDSLYRLTGETIANAGTVNYAYDAVGNRTNRASTIAQLPANSPAYTANDWLASDTYDPNGNTTASGTASYQYDALNHLTNVNSGAILITYDADGNRASKKVGTTTTYYLLDDRNPSGYVQVLEEWTVVGTSTNLAKAYNYGLDLISQRVPSTSTNYFIYDGHGSTRVLTDNAGHVANTFTYDAYGTLIASNTTAQTAYLYSGQQFDADLGFYYNRARYLNVGTGRFWTMDTSEGNSEDPLSLHKYLYCSGNPANMVDPSGHDGDLISLSISSSIGASMDAMYNGGVLTVYNALKATINGVQANESAQQILTDYLVDTAIGVGVGVAVGVAAKLSGDLIYGTSVARSACFVSGTPVATESGERPIEQIKKGDQVWSWNEETDEFCLEKVASTHARPVSEEVVVQTGDETITTTLTHPFRVKDKGWVEAGDLQPGDCLVTLSGQTETITRTTTTNAVTLVFNFEVENTHTYLVGAQPVVVHNACAWATRSASIPNKPGIYIIRSVTGERYVGQAENLATRLVKRGNHKYQALIEDPQSEVFTMTLDTSKVASSTEDALDAAENFYIKALGAKKVNKGGLNGRFQRSPPKGWENAYLSKYGFPPMGDPVAH
jgi:RHS repeat-associated protein